jgi:hypothetical protein
MNNDQVSGYIKFSANIEGVRIPMYGQVTAVNIRIPTTTRSAARKRHRKAMKKRGRR